MHLLKYGQNHGILPIMTHKNTLLLRVLYVGLILAGSAVLCSAANTHIYWTDATDDGVFRASTDGSGSAKIIAEPSGFYSGIAVNPNTFQLYWAKTGDGNGAIRQASLTELIASDLVSGSNAGTISSPSLDVNLTNNRVYWGRWTRFSLVDANGSNQVNSEFLSSTYVTSISIDTTNNLAYWVRSGGQIWSSDLTGQNSVMVFDTGVSASRLAIDVPSGKIYYSSSSTDTIYRSNFDGTGAESLITFTGTDNPTSLALDLDAGKMYYLLDGPNSIGSANLDGTSSGLIAGLTGLSNPRSLALGPIPEASTYALILGIATLAVAAVFRRKNLKESQEE